jgi:hypothetical protein
MANENNEKVFPKKYMNKIKEMPEFKEAVEGAQTDEIKKKILESERHLFETENALMADEELQKAKERAKELASSYRETKGLETAKLKYCLYILESRGIAI